MTFLLAHLLYIPHYWLSRSSYYGDLMKDFLQNTLKYLFKLLVGLFYFLGHFWHEGKSIKIIIIALEAKTGISNAALGYIPCTAEFKSAIRFRT